MQCCDYRKYFGRLMPTPLIFLICWSVGSDVPRTARSVPTCHVAVVGNSTDICLSRDRTPPATLWVSIYWGRNPCLIWWRFDPIDNVRRRLHVHANGGDDLSNNNVGGRLGMFVAAWIFAKQSEVTPRRTFDCTFVWCEQFTYLPYTSLWETVAPR